MTHTSGGGPERRVSELFSELSSELSLLLRKEMELARVELREEAAKAARAGAALSVAAVAGLFVLVYASSAAAWALAEIMPAGLAFLIVAVVWLLVAGVGAALGRNRLRQVHPVPEQTVRTLEEDVQWAKNRKS